MISDTIPHKTLAPLYEPEPVVFTFDSLGWKILAGVLIIAFLSVIGLVAYRYINNRYRRVALSSIQKETSVASIFIVLKQAAMQVYGREKVGALSGKEWLAFLDKTGQGVHFIKLEKPILLALYKEVTPSKTQIEEIRFNAKKWIKTHARKL